MCGAAHKSGLCIAPLVDLYYQIYKTKDFFKYYDYFNWKLNPGGFIGYQSIFILQNQVKKYKLRIKVFM